MSPIHAFLRVPLAGSALLVAACTTPPTQSHQVDTLPGGIVRVQNFSPSEWSDTAHVRLREVFRIRPPEGSPGELGMIWDLVVGDAGEIYVSQQGPMRIDQYSPSGEWVRSIGRQGSGPGEYQIAFLGWGEGRLIVHDPISSRTSQYDTTGVFLRSWRSNCCMQGPITTDRSGLIYVPVVPGDQDLEGGWVRFRQNGEVVDTLRPRIDDRASLYWSVKRITITSKTSVPGQPRLISVPRLTGGLLIGDNADYSIVLSDNGRDTTHLFSRRWSPAPLSIEDRQQILDGAVRGDPALAAVAHVEDIPTRSLAFQVIQVDDVGRIWVRTTSSDSPPSSRWDVFSPQGVWLGPVVMPFKNRPRSLKRNEMVVVMADSIDQPIIVRYRVEGLP